jgi:DNA-binding NtrC family response regulator
LSRSYLAPQCSAGHSAAQATANNAELRILVVDDDKGMAHTLAAILKFKGYSTEIAHSAAEALEKVAQVSFDCVFSDIRMPQVNGVELYRAIRAQRQNLPVVLMTAYASHHLVEEGLRAGALAVLTKPLDIDALLSFLSLLCEGCIVTLIDDDPDYLATLSNTLEVQGFVVQPFTDPSEAISDLGTRTRVVLLDLKLGHVSGFDVLREIKGLYPQLPVVLITGYGNELSAEIRTAIEADALTCLDKLVSPEKLIALLTQIRHQKLSQLLVD